MQVERHLINSEVNNVQFTEGGDPQLARVFNWSGFSGSVVVPLAAAEKMSRLDETVAMLAEYLDQLPNANIIERIVLIADSTISDTNMAFLEFAESVARVAGGWNLLLAVPGPSENLKTELEIAWARLLQMAFPIENYLFALARQLDPRTLTYLDSSNMWIALMRDLIRDPTAAIAVPFPATSLILVQALLAHPGGNTDVKGGSTRAATWTQLLSKLQMVLSEPVEQSLLSAIATSVTGGEPRNAEIAAKLVLHLCAEGAVEKIRDVRSLDFSAEPLGDGLLKRLKYLKELEYLVLDDTLFSSESLSHLEWLPRLRSLSVQRTKIVDSGVFFLSRCPSLEELNCSDTKISPASIKHFAEFKRLKRLHVSATLIHDDEHFRLLTAAVPGLELR